MFVSPPPDPSGDLESLNAIVLRSGALVSHYVKEWNFVNRISTSPSATRGSLSATQERALITTKPFSLPGLSFPASRIFQNHEKYVVIVHQPPYLLLQVIPTRPKTPTLKSLISLGDMYPKSVIVFSNHKVCETTEK